MGDDGQEGDALLVSWISSLLKCSYQFANGHFILPQRAGPFAQGNSGSFGGRIEQGTQERGANMS